MVPPTGAADSILVVRRNGATVDSYYGAPATQLKNYHMESESKLKKQWGERWKMGKLGKIPAEGQVAEPSSFMVHPDYLNKYGTLSNGVLTKSLKYSDTWLYGTVGVRGTPNLRPSLFLYPGVMTPSPRILPQNGKTGFASPPSGFVSQLAKYSTSGSASVRSHKVSDNRPTLKALERCQCGDQRRDLKKTAMSICRTCGGKRNSIGTLRVNPTHRPKLLEAREKPNPTTAAQDPYNMMRKNRLSVAESSESSIFHPDKVRKQMKSKSLSPLRGKTRKLLSPTFETFKPKQCENESKEEEWTNEEEEKEIEEEDRIKRKSILECEVNAYDLNRQGSTNSDDSSDELSDGVIDVNAKLKILRPKLTKTELKNRKIKVTEPEKLVNYADAAEVRVSGQLFKIFDHSSPSTNPVEGYVSDDHDGRDTADDDNERLSSPQRPPRKPKERTTAGIAFKYSKSKSKSSPNLSIKSILKKPIGNEDSESSTSLDAEQSPTEKRRQVLLRSTPKSSQNTFKKKKQVQFKVNVSNESLTEKPTEKPTLEETAADDTVQRSMSCEDLLLTIENNVEGQISSQKDPVEGTIKAQDLPEEENSPLKRSFSDRRPSVFKNKSLENLPNSSKDTSAIRTRNSRIDSRELFIEGKGLTDDGGKKVRSYEPPPAPPPLEEKESKSSNLITYAEFAKLTDQREVNPDKYLRRIRCKSLDNSVSLLKNEKAAPSPPPRQGTKARKLSSPGTIKLQVPSSNRISVVGNQRAENNKPEGDNKTVVTLSPTDEVPLPSVTILPKNTSKDYSKDFGKTSVMINNFSKEDSNKVTISVRNEIPCEDEPNSSTCTIIETGSNSTVIPVMSTDNKTTLIVGNSSGISISEETKTEKPSQYIFSNTNPEETPKVEALIDPVEAVRRNLIPHICGKEENTQSLMAKIKQSKESKGIKGQSSESLLSTYQSKRNMTNWKNAINGAFKIEDDTASLTDSFCSSVKNSSTNTSRSNSFRSNSYKSPESDYDTNPFDTSNKFFLPPDSEDGIAEERDKLEDEYEIRNGLSETKKEESENIYETIKEEPIYDQIGIKVENEESDDDIPPPLPLTLPPSLDEIEKKLPKSIFEGASKYDILSYLVDAKDRVQEDTYFSGSSTSEDADSRRLSMLEESERTSLDSGMHCRSPSDSLEAEENLRRLENCKKDTSLDSGVDLSSRISQISQASDSSDDNLILSVINERDSLKLNRKSSAEIERNDSGVGSETSHTSRSKWQASSCIREDPQHLCEDCDQIVETQVTDSGVMYAPLVCRKCSKRRSERKEIIQEIAETEEKYGRDLKIILEEFYRPMLVAGLLTPDQLSAIFLNTEELLENSEQLTEKLRDTLEIAVEQGDEDLLTVNIGKLFLEAGPMLHAFESYCTRQATAAVLLASLEKEKELLRIFLRVSQMENTVLRRMNLNSFLMVPVQRVTKYPLLLARLYKVTPPHHESQELLKEAQHNIELHLEHMNSEAKDLSAIKVWRRFSTSTASGRKSTAELEMINIKLRKMAIDVLEWNHEEVRFVMEGKLLYTQPTDNNWKRGRTIKLSPIFVLLVTLGKPNSKYKSEPDDEELTFPKKTGVREATLLLVKEKCGRYTLIREPLFLDKIIVCCETDADEYFEIQELSTKDTIIFKAEDGERTKEWYKQLQYHAQILGSWRRRRNALANIMINGMMARTYST